MALLTARELAAELKVHEDEVYRNAAAGKIPSYKFGRSRRFDLREVLAASRHAVEAEQRRVERATVATRR